VPWRAGKRTRCWTRAGPRSVATSVATQGHARSLSLQLERGQAPPPWFAHLATLPAGARRGPRSGISETLMAEPAPAQVLLERPDERRTRRTPRRSVKPRRHVRAADGARAFFCERAYTENRTPFALTPSVPSDPARRCRPRVAWESRMLPSIRSTS